MAVTWVVSDIDFRLNVEISRVQKRVTGKLNNENMEYYRDDILDVDLDLEELCEFRHMAVRPHVKEVMNALIVKLEHEVKIKKSNNKGLEATRTKWTEVAAGIRKRNISHNITCNTIQDIHDINTTQISRVQPPQYTKERSTLGDLRCRASFATSELAKGKINTKLKLCYLEIVMPGAMQANYNRNLKNDMK
jgi:hypothetical protein